MVTNALILNVTLAVCFLTAGKRYFDNNRKLAAAVKKEVGDDRAEAAKRMKPLVIVIERVGGMLKFLQILADIPNEVKRASNSGVALTMCLVHALHLDPLEATALHLATCSCTGELGLLFTAACFGGPFWLSVTHAVSVESVLYGFCREIVYTPPEGGEPRNMSYHVLASMSMIAILVAIADDRSPTSLFMSRRPLTRWQMTHAGGIVLLEPTHAGPPTHANREAHSGAAPCRT